MDMNVDLLSKPIFESFIRYSPTPSHPTSPHLTPPVIYSQKENNFFDSLDMLEDKSLKIEDDSDLPSWSGDERGVRVLMNVHSFGAVGDGVFDDTKAFGDAWKEAYFTDCIHRKQCNI
ncbi:unnamed protein product [Lactuca virosa]|uniref:Pectin acetylesterase n=1 Tax=Lactuca virosa TaxID=75947 RepID=A0AAU9LLX7_9ASTR|nr:unnamed protein product [Lactuca virosa]